MFAVETDGRAAGELHLFLLFVVGDRMPVIVHGARFVQDPDARLLQAVTELEVLVTVARETLVEAADALEVAFANRGVSGEKVEPRQAPASVGVQRPAPLGAVAQA